jgi:hypothetical protein
MPEARFSTNPKAANSSSQPRHCSTDGFCAPGRARPPERSRHRARTLVVNLPGSTGGVKDGLEVLDRLVEHAVHLVRGERTAHD